MSKFWRIVLGIETLGVVLALALYLLWANPRPGAHGDHAIDVLSILCPGSWLFIKCLDCEIGFDIRSAWLATLLANLVIYGIIGTITATVLSPRRVGKS